MGNLADSFKGKTILAVGAHPDDLDFGCAGTIARAVSEGAKVYYLILTDGSKGLDNLEVSVEELKHTRQEEQRKAAEILGVKRVFFLTFVDGELENNLELRRQIVKVIRELKPDIVITIDPTLIYDEERGMINHPDHRICGQATLDAVFPFARNIRTFPELVKDGLGIHHVKEVYLMFNFNKVNYYIDITEYMEKKIEAVKMHLSQKDTEDAEEKIKNRSSVLGKKGGCEFAEGFTRIILH